MRWFLDTEFNEDGRTIELISIALVCERPAVPPLYCVSREFNLQSCNEFVQANVLPLLPPRAVWRSREQIRDAIVDVLGPEPAPAGCDHKFVDSRQCLKCGWEPRKADKPEIWAYFSAYDWVALCQLFGRMVDLPRWMPMWCRDLKQLMADRCIVKDDLPKQLGPAHDALGDAVWARDAYVHIMQRGQVSP